MHRSGSCQPSVQHEVMVRAGALEVWDARKKLGPAVAFLAQERSEELAFDQGTGVGIAVVWASQYGEDIERILHDCSSFGTSFLRLA